MFFARPRAWIGLALLVSELVIGSGALAQQNPASPDASPATQTGSGSPSAPLQITLKAALERARQNSPAYQGAATDAAIARESKKQAFTALLPSVKYNNSLLLSQLNALGEVRYLANDRLHEYTSQADIHETIGLAEIASFRSSAAGAAVARAKEEIASRGLVVTVVQTYFALAAAQEKAAISQRAAEEGERFLKITQDLEHGGEVAHSDVIKAELQTEERRRQLQEAQLSLLNARLNLAVLVFPDFNTNFQLTDDLHSDIALPRLEEVQQLASRNNPEIREALASVEQAGHDVTIERAGYLPSLSFDYFYGIDAPNFGVNRADGQRNLGYSALATLNIPIWNWGATQSRIKQAELHRMQTKRELSFTQRKLLADLQSLYGEAQTAESELAGLKRAAALSSESLRLTSLRYRDGESTVLEVVDAQNTATAAEAAYQDGAVRYRVALANLQTLTGVLPAP